MNNKVQNQEGTDKRKFDFKNAIYKIYADLEFGLYSIDLSKFNKNFVIDEDEMYNQNFDGIPTILGVLDEEETGIRFISKFDTSRLSLNSIYCQFTFKYNSSFSTKSFSTIEDLKLSEISIYRIDRYEHKLVGWCLEDKLLELGLI